jgi:hypothetical protein
VQASFVGKFSVFEHCGLRTESTKKAARPQIVRQAKTKSVKTGICSRIKNTCEHNCTYGNFIRVAGA